MTDQLEALVNDLIEDNSLRETGRLFDRLEAIDRLEALLADEAGSTRDDAGRVSRQARAILQRMDAVNDALYQEIREQIRRGDRPDWPGRHVDVAGPEGYDYLDSVVNGVLRPQLGESEVAELPSDMVPYQPTPARHIFDLLRRAAINEHDVFVDLGSGLGHVPLMVNICTGARSIGIEREAGYVECANRIAVSLRLSGVSFLNQDARVADFACGTVFYLYTPFKGAILRSVLDSLREESHRRSVQICSYGPCTLSLVGEAWLKSSEPVSTDRIAIFRS